MSGIMHRDLLRFIWICNYPNLNLEPLMKAYIKRQLVTSVAICLAFLWWMCLLWNIFGFNKWGQIRRVVKWNPYFKAALLISRAYATLLVVNARYICVVFIPIIVLIFIGALYLVVTAKENSKSDEDNHNEAKKANDVGTASDGNGNGGAGDNDNGLFATVVVPCWVLCCMGYFNVDNFVVSQFLLFLTSTLGELALMMARLPSEEVAAAFQIIRRATLVVVLATTHTMAAELLGDDVVLACTPELLTGLVWFSIYFGHCGGGSAMVIVDMVTSRKARFFAFFTVVVPIMAWIVNSSNGSEAATHLLSMFISTLVACSFLIILPSLCVFVLRQWPAKTTAAPSSELDGAIQLLSFCRDMMIISATSYLVLTLLVDVRLRLQAQRILANIVSRFVNNSVMWLFNTLEPTYMPH